MEPYLPPTTSSGYVHSTLDESTLLRPLMENKGWIKFVGVMAIVMGVFTALSIWGIVIAWLPIWIGVLMMQSAGALEDGRGEDAMRDLAKSVKLCGIYILVYLTLVVVFLVIVFGFIGFAAFASQLS